MSNRLSQIPIEIAIRSDAPISARISQLPVEIIVLPLIGHGMLSQLPVEILVLESLVSAEKVQFFIMI